MDTKVYLRHLTTRLYYSGWKRWTSDPQQAVDYKNTANALEKAREQQLGHVEVVVVEGGSRPERVLPVVESGGR